VLQYTSNTYTLILFSKLILSLVDIKLLTHSHPETYTSRGMEVDING